MKKYISKFIAIICLFIYVLFGFLNSGNIGFCLGDEHGSHFGVIIAGYETCCHKDEITQNQETLGCECNDVDVQSTIISQSSFNIFNFTQVLETVNSINSQLIAVYINYLDISKPLFYKKVPPDLLTVNLIKSSVILLI